MAGKFDSNLDAALYELTLDGGDEETGDVSEMGWYAVLLRGGPSLADELSDANDISQEELDDLRASAGVIVEENDQGFVSVSYYDTKKQLDEEWKTYEDDADEFWDASETIDDE